MAVSAQTLLSSVEPLNLAYDRERLEDVGFMTCMTLVLLGNYAQTGHFGGPLAYTPYNVAMHLAGPDFGGLRYDYRRPKHPYGDKFMLAGGHTIPTCYALWMIMGEALARKYKATGDKRYYVDPHVAMLGIDALGFRRGAGAMATILQENGLVDHPLFAEAKVRGIRALAGHAESTDVTNDVNGGPSGIGIATAAGKAAFWDMVGSPISGPTSGPKIIAFEGEFAMTEGHAQELKTQALALQVGKRLRVMFSDNNAGIDDSLLGGVIASKYDHYNLVEQWTSYGWNVFTLDDGNDYDQVVAALKTMEDWDPNDRRPMVVHRKDHQGLLAVRLARKNCRAVRSSGRLSQPSLRDENELGIFRRARQNIRAAIWRGVCGHSAGSSHRSTRERLIQFKANIDIAMSVLERNGLGDWLADRLVAIGDTVKDETKLHFDVKHDPFQDDRLRVANLPVDPQKVTVKNRISGAEKSGLDRSLPQARRNCRNAPRDFGNHQVDELRHRQPLHHAGRRSVGIHQRGTRQPVGPL